MADAYSTGLKLLAIREHSVASFSEKLHKKFPDTPEEVEKVVGDFVEKKWLSDARYASEFIRDRSEYRGWGPEKIKQHLRQKGVADDVISEALVEGLDETVQLQQATGTARGKWNQFAQKKPDESDFIRSQRVAKFLVGRGFSFEVALSAVDQARNEN